MAVKVVDVHLYTHILYCPFFFCIFGMVFSVFDVIDGGGDISIYIAELKKEES